MYRLANIKDIWIIGNDKYTGRKEIEKYTDLYYDVLNNKIKIDKIYNYITINNYIGTINKEQELKSIKFINGNINANNLVTEEMIDNFVKREINNKIEKEKSILVKKESKAIEKLYEYIITELETTDFFGENISFSGGSYFTKY